MANDGMLKRHFELRSKGLLKTEGRAATAFHLLRSAAYGNAVLSSISAIALRFTDVLRGRDRFGKVIKAHAPAEKLADRRWLRRIKRDLYYTYFYNRMSADEYFRYQFEDLSRTGRHKYISDGEFGERCRLIDDPEELRILNDKYNSYLAFRPYYKREVLLIRGREDETAFADFCTRHEVFFVKPLSDRGGHGVQRLRLDQDFGPERAFAGIIEGYGSAIVEQPIIQAEAMARFHPNSINTARVVTLRKKGAVEIIQTSVRLGMGESVVDNGCLSSSVDPATGIITSLGRAAHENGLYLRHPDTGVQILGNRIPAWDELLEQVKQQAVFFKKQALIGWDMAYSIEGWVIVEVNSHPAIQTLSGNGVGARELFEYCEG